VFLSGCVGFRRRPICWSGWQHLSFCSIVSGWQQLCRCRASCVGSPAVTGPA
jgi:hypothetical protein